MRRGRRKRNPEVWLTPRQIAGLLGVHRNTPLNWCRHDGLPHKRVGAGGYVYIRERDLWEWLDEYYPELKNVGGSEIEGDN
jgi:excisionase family DNA binding protein